MERIMKMKHFVIKLCLLFLFVLSYSTDSSAAVKYEWMEDQIDYETAVPNIRSKIYDARVFYTYERHQWNGCRIVEETDGNKTVKYSYNDNSSVTQIMYDDIVVDYNYADTKDKYSYMQCTSFVYEGKEYYFIRDEKNWISGFSDEEGNQICKYVYDDDSKNRYVYKINVDGAYTDVTGDMEYIGNINLLCKENEVYDILSGYSIISGCLYDPDKDRAIWMSLDYKLIEDEDRDFVSYNSNVDKDIQIESEIDGLFYSEENDNLRTTPEYIINGMYSCIIAFLVILLLH